MKLDLLVEEVELDGHGGVTAQHSVHWREGNLTHPDNRTTTLLAIWAGTDGSSSIGQTSIRKGPGMMYILSLKADARE